jgi:hypothetical protein
MFPPLITKTTFFPSILPLLDNKGQAQVKRPGARHGQVIHGAAHRQPADIPAREEQWLDRVRI